MLEELTPTGTSRPTTSIGVDSAFVRMGSTSVGMGWVMRPCGLSRYDSWLLRFTLLFSFKISWSIFRTCLPHLFGPRLRLIMASGSNWPVGSRANLVWHHEIFGVNRSVVRWLEWIVCRRHFDLNYWLWSGPAWQSNLRFSVRHLFELLIVRYRFGDGVETGTQTFLGSYCRLGLLFDV